MSRYPIELPTFKRLEFEAEQAKGSFAVNMDRIPLLTYNGVTIGQSKTIERFLARQFGLIGADEFEAAFVDMVGEHVRDIVQKYSDKKSGKSGEALEAAKTEFVNVDLPKWFAKLEKALPGSDFAVGNKISLADISIHQLVNYFDDKAGAVRAYAGCSKVARSVEVVEERCRDYFASRPVTAI